MTEGRFGKKRLISWSKMVDLTEREGTKCKNNNERRWEISKRSINEAFSPKTVIAKLLTWKQRGKLEGPDRGGEWKKKRVKERGKGMTCGSEDKEGEGEEEKEREEEKEEAKKRGKERKEGRKETRTLAGAPRKGKSAPSQTQAIAFTLQYRTTSCLFCYSLILCYHLFHCKRTV